MHCNRLLFIATLVWVQLYGAENAPLVLAKQGSFFVNQQNSATAFPSGNGTQLTGHSSTRGMYVQYQIPQTRGRGMYPIIMVHGAAHTGKTYEETPDGRMGWAEYFVRRGVPVYVVDHSGRARSGFDPSPTNQAKVEGKPTLVPSFLKFTNEQAWTTFRFGGKAFVPYANTQFPVKAQDEYFAQMVPNTETTYPGAGQNTIDALVKLLERTGPAVIFVHSQSGGYGIAAAIARPDLVKAVVSVEPRNCAVSSENIQAVFTKVPLLTMFGDFQDGNEDWSGRMAECVDTVKRITSARGTAENMYLPDAGIRGNSHMLMMDLNNQQLAGIIFSWLDRHAHQR
jgi:pimeloyl-ACP methyl ester carboxylesterase